MSSALKEMELKDLLRFRLDRYVEMGFNLEDAEILTATDVDWHDAQALLDRGCSHGLALRILLPD